MFKGLGTSRLLAAALLALGLPVAGRATTGASRPPTSPTRFVVLFPPSTGPVDIRTNDVRPKILAKHVLSGTVTDYLSVPAGSGVSVVTGTGKYTAGVSTKKGQRATIAVGLDGQGDPAFADYIEAHGRLVEAGGQNLGSHPLPSGEARVVGDGTGIGPDLDDGGFTDGGFSLGEEAGGCLAGAKDDVNGTEATDVVGAASQAWYVADPGSLSLAWFADNDCTQVTSAPASATLKARQGAYAFAWFPADHELHLLVVPINASGSGRKGVVDSGPGPGLIEPGQVGTAPPPLDTSEPDMSDPTDTPPDDTTG